MKIACIGNSNNSFFVIARYLRERGYDADLFVFQNTYELFLPNADAYNTQFEAYTYTIGWSQNNWYATKASAIQEILKPYDFIISSGVAPAFLHKAGIKSDLFIPYGYDLYAMPFFKWDYGKSIKNNIKLFLFSRAQKKGIENAKAVAMDYTNTEWEGMFKGIDIASKRIMMSTPILHQPTYTAHNLDAHKNEFPYLDTFEKLRKKYQWLITQHCSQHWKNVPTPSHYKGNDQLIKGYADYIIATPNSSIHLILWEYGYEHGPLDSKKLIAELGIEAHVTWVPAMPRKYLMIALSYSDLGFGEIGESYFSYGTVYEYIALGKPVAYRRDDSLYAKWYPERFPYIDIASAADVTQLLAQFTQHPEYYKEIGKQAQYWFNTFISQKPIDTYEQLILNHDNRKSL